jgi:hypothetical protein
MKALTLAAIITATACGCASIDQRHFPVVLLDFPAVGDPFGDDTVFLAPFVVGYAIDQRVCNMPGGGQLGTPNHSCQ